MKKSIFLFLFVLPSLFTGCAELQDVVSTYPQAGVTNAEIASGLRQALRKGIDQEVAKLTQKDGFYNNEKVRILLPEELQQVESTLRSMGLGNLADEGIIALNRAAEEAVKEATPIFVNAVSEITFEDARNILLGPDTAATSFLENKTEQALYDKFYPVVTSSFERVGAKEIWNNIIVQYNALPLTRDVNPDLADYVTGQALDGVYTMIAEEEKEIRSNFAARTTDLLRRVFAIQDTGRNQ